MIRLKKHKCSDIVINTALIIFFIVSFFLTQSYFGTANYVIFPKLYKSVFFGSIVIAVGKLYGKFKINEKEKKLFLRLVVPFLIIMIWSILLCILFREVSVNVSINELQTRIVMPLAACALYYLFGMRLVNCIFWAASINYIIYVLEFIRINGIQGIIKFISLTDAAETGKRPLEVHEVTFIYGLLILFYILNWSRKKDTFKLVISILFCFLGYKRILFLGLMIGIAIYYMSKKNNGKFINRVSFFLLLFCFFWVFLTGSGVFVDLANRFEVELSARDKILAFLSNKYDISLLYFGKGVGYVHNTMYQLVLNNISGTSGFHNDILLYYIDLGCIPFILFFTNIIVGNTRFVMKNYGFCQAINYLVLLGYTLICWTTDNLATYPNYLLVYNILTIILIVDFGRDNKLICTK